MCFTPSLSIMYWCTWPRSFVSIMSAVSPNFASLPMKVIPGRCCLLNDRNEGPSIYKMHFCPSAIFHGDTTNPGNCKYRETQVCTISRRLFSTNLPTIVLAVAISTCKLCCIVSAEALVKDMVDDDGDDDDVL